MTGCIEGPGEKTTEIGKTSDWCDVGSYVTLPGYKMKVTGIEKHTIEGKTMDMCCHEIEASGDGEVVKSKSCMDYESIYMISWVYYEEKGKYVKATETFPKDGKSCVRAYDVEGEITMEVCN